MTQRHWVIGVHYFMLWNPFDYSEHIEMLVDFLIQGNYEVRHKARILIEAINKDIPNGVLLNCIMRVKREVDELAEKHDFLSESLDGLFKLKNE